MKKICKNYVGVSCVNGIYPQAQKEEYEERGVFIPKKCEDYWMYKGCEDCALYETKYCIHDKMS